MVTDLMVKGPMEIIQFYLETLQSQVLVAVEEQVLTKLVVLEDQEVVVHLLEEEVTQTNHLQQAVLVEVMLVTQDQ